MRFYKNAVLYSPSDLVRYLGCNYASYLDSAKLLSVSSGPQRADDDAMAKLLQQAGLNHEDTYRSKLATDGGLVEIDDKSPLDLRAADTIKAMRDGAKAIFQATFLRTPWHGYADFLIRVDEPSELGDWSYEPVDTKLSRSTKPAYVVQLGLYAKMLADIQGKMPIKIHVQLGDGRRESFRLNEFDKVLTAAVDRFAKFVQSGATYSQPQPCSACGLCSWRDHCAQLWKEQDHLSRVSGLGKPQAVKLREAGIETVAALLALIDGAKVPRMSTTTLAKLRAQARLQQARWAGGEPKVEMLEADGSSGFASLPQPNPADLFFDLEGDPLEEGGLDYLWGVHYRDGPHKEFRFRWGHDHAAERLAFEDTLDWMCDHLQRHPRAHVYHYAPYEITSLRRLSTLHASREDALDELLRQRRFVDLYGIVRKAIRTSEDNLSLKTLEVFFAKARAGEVTKADQSIVEYKSWQQIGDQKILDDILDYNKVDCENTEALRDWLIKLRPSGLPWRSAGPITEVAEEKAEARVLAEQRSQKLIDAIISGDTPASMEGRTLVGHLTQFHRRADKPAFWSMFDRCEREAEELVEDGDCIGDIVPDTGADGNWQRPEKRSTISSYRFPSQDTKLREGSVVLHAPSLQKVGKIVSLDCEEGTVEITRGKAAKGIWPSEGSLIPEPTVPNATLVAAVRRVAKAWAGVIEDEAPVDELRAKGDDAQLGNPTHKPSYRALLDLIEREKPRLLDWDGGPLVRDGESLVEAATLRCLAMDRSTLFIQGPPGTGKTYTSAHVICSLIAAGKRVGVSSNSHKVINNLLAKVEDIAEETGLSFSGVKKFTRGSDDQRLNGRIITDVDSASDVYDYRPDLVGGTAWLFADEGFDQMFDYLFVDEAGQVSLGLLVAMGSSARNIVLVGDQMQLAQPLQGSHPGESGLSALDYLLQGEATVAPERGILLDTSWRMHPSICKFISDVVYDGRLKAHSACARQRIQLQAGHKDEIAEQGLRFVAMDHIGCGQRSDIEVQKVKELVTGLLGTKFTARDGTIGIIGWKNILIVAPYNMQVNALAAALPTVARVGTVDKFQGQEAEIVIVSLTTSTPDDLPRHVEFFYSKNRLNVAISRARTLAIVLANPKLLELDAKTVDHLRLVNTLAWVVEEGLK